MSGRPGPDDDAWEKPSSTSRSDPRSPSLNGTSQHRALPPRPQGSQRIERPPRPPGSARIEQSPTPRVARPKRQAEPPRKLRRSLMIWGSVFLICAVLACGIGFAAFNYFNAINAAAGPTATATDFLSALKNQNYDQAFADLNVTITLTMDRTAFKQQGQADDHCYGMVTDYSEVNGSAQIIPNTNTWSFTYTITRSSMKSPYQMTIQLKPDPEKPNTWRISNYGGDLGPAHPGIACH